MKEDLKKELDLISKEIIKKEKLRDKMEDDGNYNSDIYKELDELYAKKEELQSELNGE